MKYKTTSEFNKDFKTLRKKYKTLESDFETMKKQLLETYFEQRIQPSHKALVCLSRFDNCALYKVRSFACKSLKGTSKNSGIRVQL
jgi:mRNA-degrading endonuclease YafQ of YafQ-DinJ toxin-antitoxin module